MSAAWVVRYCCVPLRSSVAHPVKKVCVALGNDGLFIETEAFWFWAVSRETRSCESLGIQTILQRPICRPLLKIAAHAPARRAVSPAVCIQYGYHRGNEYCAGRLGRGVGSREHGRQQTIIKGIIKYIRSDSS